MTKTPEADAPEAVEPETGVTEEGLPWRIVRPGGERHKIRALTVQEDDDAYDAALDEQTGRLNGRLYGRLQLASSIIEPAGITVDDIAKWTIAKLVFMLDARDKINSLPAADAAGNGSGPTS